MSEPRDRDAVTRGAARGTVRPWQTPASLGLTEDDLTPVREGPPQGRQPEPDGPCAAVSPWRAPGCGRP
ncbi:hypothetical protein [Streptomyces sp. NPDC001508]|uniref:hypothetical protein n=1 Tax=Streptomyces sp. NPDC001508 TaxID=3154656 RepID=UPI00331CE6C3